MECLSIVCPIHFITAEKENKADWKEVISNVPLYRSADDVCRAFETVKPTFFTYFSFTVSFGFMFMNPYFFYSNLQTVLTCNYDELEDHDKFYYIPSLVVAWFEFVTLMILLSQMLFSFVFGLCFPVQRTKVFKEKGQWTLYIYNMFKNVGSYSVLKFMPTLPNLSRISRQGLTQASGVLDSDTKLDDILLGILAIFLLCLLGVAPLAALIKLRQNQFVYTTVIRDWTLHEVFRFVALMNNISSAGEDDVNSVKKMGLIEFLFNGKDGTLDATEKMVMHEFEGAMIGILHKSHGWAISTVLYADLSLQDLEKIIKCAESEARSVAGSAHRSSFFLSEPDDEASPRGDSIDSPDPDMLQPLINVHVNDQTQ